MSMAEGGARSAAGRLAGSPHISWRAAVIALAKDFAASRKRKARRVSAGGY
jgi:hypothetical protein